MTALLWNTATKVSQSARASGALSSLDTIVTPVTEGPLQFQLRILNQLRKKQAQATRDPDFNPFLPHEEALFVSTVAPHHKCLLNKFNVLEQHLLLVTELFEPQQSLLSQDDFQALFSCLQQTDALAFYNSGPIAGASQRHKHLQLIRLSKQLETLLPFAEHLALLKDQVPYQLPQLPFRHAALALPSGLFDHPLHNSTGAQTLFNLYERLRVTLGIEVHDGLATRPYNLLLTQSWMMIVPRSHERFQEISLNALAFVGSILVKDAEQAQALQQAGLARALSYVSEADR